MAEPNRRRGNPAMVKGAPSLNPRGRPRAGLELAECICEHVPPAALVARAIELVKSKDERVAIAALAFLADRGWIRPPVHVDLDASVSTTPALDVAAFPMNNARCSTRFDARTPRCLTTTREDT
jgi:hypothetical protein